MKEEEIFLKLDLEWVYQLIIFNHIQLNSHTIIENHPDMIPKAQAWAADKSNVTIVEGDWYSVKDTLSTYDGLFMDTYGDKKDMNEFSSSIIT